MRYAKKMNKGYVFLSFGFRNRVSLCNALAILELTLETRLE